jgi:hypothetical protein
MGVAFQCDAQATPSPETRLVASDLVATLEAGPTDASSSAPDPQASTGAAASAAASISDNQWHADVVPYLWFPGMHGTVGAKGHDLSVHASAGDVLSHFRFGLAGVTEFRRNRFVIPIDLMWVRLAADKSLPFPEAGASSADVKIAEVLLTPEVGYRVIDQEKIKVDGLAGFRYWHLGQTLELSGTTQTNPSVSASLNWVDPIIGSRIQIPLSPKLSANIFGDVGGWGVGSQLEYQVGGLLGYQVKPKWILQAGYRYMDVDYQSGGNTFDVAMPGVVFGVTYKFK